MRVMKLGCENITLKELAVAVASLAAFIAACGTIYHFIKKALYKLFEEQTKSINKRIDTLDERVDRNNLESCKNYLVYFLSDLDHGKEPDEIELERFFEVYEYYKKAGGNSYIKHKVEKLQAEKKI